MSLLEDFAFVERGEHFKLPQLRLRELGLEHVPAVPLDIAAMLDTLIKLGIREKQVEQAYQSLSRTYTIAGRTDRAHAFLFGTQAADANRAAARASLQAFLSTNPSDISPGALAERLKEQDEALAQGANGGGGDPLTRLSLDDPKQWSMSWTTFPDVYGAGRPRLDEWAATVDVKQPDKATEAFFPTIAREGLAYNLLLLKKVDGADVGRWRELFGMHWTAALDAAAQAGLLYVIDLRLYETLQPQTVAGVPRFTPSTVVVLVQDAATKALTPELIRVAGGANQPKIFSRRGSTTPSAWLYALQAAKVSLTVYGIWIGHVYHWHIVTAAMQMTMFETLSRSNPARRLLEPHSSYLIPFDDVLLLKWSAAAPPTSIASAWQFLELLDLYAGGRGFFDQDPTTALQRLGLAESNFTVNEPWDQYPVVGQLLDIWDATEHYVNTYVDQAYPTDEDVRSDQELHDWMAASGRPDGGNVRGLPEMDSTGALKHVLHSLVYRITAHGFARLWRSGEPALTFVANFPPCLQDATIPDPADDFDTRTLLRYLPNTGTIGGMVQFYFVFHFSTPYVPFVPLAGPESELFFDDDASNQALIELRRFIAGFIERFEPDTPQIWQWPRNIET